MSQYAIKIENLVKEYRIGSLNKPQQLSRRELITNTVMAPINRLRSVVQNQLPQYSDATHMALKGISLNIDQGEVVGLIGANGAGKSTLLKIISRITPPSDGEVRLRGRVAALLEVGTGFNKELTGRENIYLNGSILGMSKQEIDERLDAIVEFAGIEKYIDTPIKRYSSGMGVRLGFAVAAHLEPDVLLVDEVLAVGDLAFQKKSLGFMDESSNSGRTVIFVSHNMDMILGLCKRVIWIDNGLVKMDGNPHEVVQAYADESFKKSSVSLAQREDRNGTGRAKFTDFYVQDANTGKRVNAIQSGQAVEFVMHYEAQEHIDGPVSAYFWIHDRYDRRLIRLWSRFANSDVDYIKGAGKITCRIDKFPVTPGSYIMHLKLIARDEDLDGINSGYMLEVIEGDFFGGNIVGSRKVGQFFVDQSWHHTPDTHTENH